MRFLYKIHSGYDGFSPRRIPDRLKDEELELGWKRYIDTVEIGHEVWVYFHGPHTFENGVYVKGIVRRIDLKKENVYVRIRRFATDKPLTNAATTQRVAEAVATRMRQVFLFPQELAPSPQCTMGTIADTCVKRLCEDCRTWKTLPLIKEADCCCPHPLADKLGAVVPAYWVIPTRCYLGKAVGASTRRTSELFYRFKTGEEALAYPLALAMYESLRKRKLLNYDCIVPIPLSPDKARANEIHRTRLLSKELAALMGVKTLELLTLNQAISKRKMFNDGATKSEFEKKYLRALEVSDRINSFKNVLLVDDVCTRGTTLSCTLKAIRSHGATCEVSAATAGQMILKDIVENEQRLIV